jgi:integrase
MRIRLTSQHVQSLPAVDGVRTDYWDVIVPTLVLRVSATSRSWACRHQQGHGRAGRRITLVTIGRTNYISLAEARDKAREILEHGIQAPGGLTVAVIAGRAMAALELTPNTRREWQRLVDKEIVPALGAIPAAELDRPTVRAWMREVGGRSRWTADHAFRVLRRFYSWAEDEELIPANPLHRVKAPWALPSNDRVLAVDELRRLLGALARLRLRSYFDPDTEREEVTGWAYADATLLLLLTMVRREGVLGMRRSELYDLDGKAPRWVIPKERMKSGREHLVPLSAQAVAVVRRRRRAVAAMERPEGAPALDTLFPAGGRHTGEDRPMTWPSSWVRELREEMRPVTLDARGQVEGPGPVDTRWTVHGLRHSAATALREHLGVDRDVVALLLSHRLPGITSVYDRAEKLAERRAALERWGEWLERMKEEQRGGRVLPLRRRR